MVGKVLTAQTQDESLDPQDPYKEPDMLRVSPVLGRGGDIRADPEDSLVSQPD